MPSHVTSVHSNLILHTCAVLKCECTWSPNPECLLIIVCIICLVFPHLFQIDAFQHMQHFVQGMQQQAQHAIAAEDQQHKQELHKLMARSVLVIQAALSSFEISTV